MLPQLLDLRPHLGLGAGIEDVQREWAEPFHRRARAQLVDDRERRDFPHRRLGPAATKGQFELAVTTRQLVFRKAESCEPGEKFRRKDLRAAIEAVTRKPYHFFLGKAQASRVVELVAQFLFVDLVGKAHRLRAVDQRKGRVHVRIELPDHLQHQKLVEIRIEQAADDRIELPGMVIDPSRDIGLWHAIRSSWTVMTRSEARRSWSIS